MRQLFFEEQHQAFWRAFEQDLQKLEARRGSLPAKQITLFVQDYRTVCHHLAVATDRCYSGGLTDYLQYLCERAHQLLYVGQQVSLWVRFRDFVRHGFPQLVRCEKKLVWLAHALFYLPFAVAFLLTAFVPESVDKIAGLGQGPELADSYKEMMEQYAAGSNREAWQNFTMAGFYIFNNITIAFQSFVSGILFGLGTVYVTVSNGWIIGGAMGYMVKDPAGPAFFSFVGAHGAFELTGIVLAAAGGLRLGLALLNPQGLSRRDALRIQGKQAVGLMNGGFLLLFIAAFIEGFWSPITSIPMMFKYMVSVVMWLLVYAYLLYAGRRAA
ncbi:MULTISPECIES: stage II sporulation protein M [Eikenella]|uniref:Stage II sporulation protein M n=1 Tax=Eikenella longinqua TaxID=1795827 RepID=A0A1A9RWC3_9NEIS|nr:MULTISPECIES: stage II sporulation protein M [Eikenella]OAM26711.1 hypothetical protein A7P95_08085 [Eikenella longinqua]